MKELPRCSALHQAPLLTYRKRSVKTWGATNTDLSHQIITREEDGPCSPRLLFKTRNIPQCCDTPSLASVSTSCFTWKQWYKNNGKPLVSKKRKFRKMLSEPAGANDRRTSCACLSANSWSDCFPPYTSFCLFFIAPSHHALLPLQLQPLFMRRVGLQARQ